MWQRHLKKKSETEIKEGTFLEVADICVIGGICYLKLKIITPLKKHSIVLDLTIKLTILD